MHHKIKIAVFLITLSSATHTWAAYPSWRVAADARIYTNRMRNIEISVEDASGAPIQNAPVKVEMQRHAFHFGSAVHASIFSKAQDGITLNANEQAMHDYTFQLFNTVVFENDLKWRYERSNTENNIKKATSYLTARKIMVRGHPMIWPHRDKAGEVDHDFQLSDGTYSDSDIKTRWNAAGQTDSAAFSSWIQGSITKRITRMGTTYGNTIGHWDVLNEVQDHDTSGDDIWLERRWSNDGIDLMSSTDLRPTAPTGEDQLADIRAQWFKIAHQSGTTATLFWNNFHILNNSYQLARDRLDAFENMYKSLHDPARVNAPNALHGVGMQAHFSRGVVSPSTIWSRLEMFASVDRSLQLAITEYDFDLGATYTPRDAAEHMENVLVTFFSHPQATTFVVWGIWDGNHWKGDAPLFDTNWNLKPSGEVYTDLVFGDWWTRESTNTTSNGKVTIRAFHGEHKITATINGQEYYTTAWLGDETDTPLQVTIKP